MGNFCYHRCNCNLSFMFLRVQLLLGLDRYLVLCEIDSSLCRTQLTLYSNIEYFRKLFALLMLNYGRMFDAPCIPSVFIFIRHSLNIVRDIEVLFTFISTLCLIAPFPQMIFSSITVNFGL